MTVRGRGGCFSVDAPLSKPILGAGWTLDKQTMMYVEEDNASPAPYLSLSEGVASVRKWVWLFPGCQSTAHT